MSVPVRARTLGAWSLWLVTVGCCAAGLVTTLIWTRPLTPAIIAGRRRPCPSTVVRPHRAGPDAAAAGHPISWLSGAAGWFGPLKVPWVPWFGRSFAPAVRCRWPPSSRPCCRGLAWAPAISLGLTLPFLLLPDGRLRSPR